MSAEQVARLVLEYLRQECPQTAQAFLKESRLLRAHHKPSSLPSLNAMVTEYTILKQKEDDRVQLRRGLLAVAGSNAPQSTFNNLTQLLEDYAALSAPRRPPPAVPKVPSQPQPASQLSSRQRVPPRLPATDPQNQRAHSTALALPARAHASPTSAPGRPVESQSKPPPATTSTNSQRSQPLAVSSPGPATPTSFFQMVVSSPSPFQSPGGIPSPLPHETVPQAATSITNHERNEQRKAPTSVATKRKSLAKVVTELSAKLRTTTKKSTTAQSATKNSRSSLPKKRRQRKNGAPRKLFVAESFDGPGLPFNGTILPCLFSSDSDGLQQFYDAYPSAGAIKLVPIQENSEDEGDEGEKASGSAEDKAAPVEDGGPAFNDSLDDGLNWFNTNSNGVMQAMLGQALMDSINLHLKNAGEEQGREPGAPPGSALAFDQTWMEDPGALGLLLPGFDSSNATPTKANPRKRGRDTGEVSPGVQQEQSPPAKRRHTDPSPPSSSNPKTPGAGSAAMLDNVDLDKFLDNLHDR